MGAYVREFGAKFARFIAVWTMGLAYAGATLYYQLSQLTTHPLSSGIWVIGIVAASGAIFWWMKRQGLRAAQHFEAQTV